MKLTTRLLLIALMICLVFSVALSTLLQMRAFRADLERETRRGLQGKELFAASMQASVQAFDGGRDMDSLQRALRITVQYMRQAGLVALADGGGLLTFDNFPEELAELLGMMPGVDGQYVLRSYGGREYQLIRDRVVLGRQPFTLYFAWDVSAVYQSAHQQGVRAAWLLLGLWALLALALWPALRRCLGPLRRLTVAASQLATGDYAARAPVVHPEDEVGQLARTFNQMAEATQGHIAQLTRQSEARRRFIADMAHEMKTPMTSMIGYADLMRRSDLDADRRQQALDAIVDQGERLERMAFKLMHLSRLDAGTPPDFRDCRARDLFYHAQQAVEAACRQKQIRLIVEEQGQVFRCDSDLMHSLLQNLLTNAIRFSAPGGRVWLRAGEGQMVVADEGEGIPPEHLPHVTEAFYMADKSRARSQQGAGLGLALCSRIAQLHGATLSIESQPGQGTRVILSFTSP
jgi:signal transduction histidine kinase